MNMRSVFVAVCPCCGYDVARVLMVEGGYRVACDPAGNGCGAAACTCPSEGEAIARWNGRASKLAVAMIGAAKRRRGGAA